jgi:hopanoid biosynthesis associated radical SAM protein HpnH
MTGNNTSKRPTALDVRLAAYILKNKIRGRKRFPLVTMLEPLEQCNLRCVGCGRLREYQNVLDKHLTVDEALDAVHVSGTPIVSIAGGEPTIHPEIGEIVNRMVAEKYFIYLCTNGLLMEKAMERIPPSKYFSWVVHMDGTEERHDSAVDRPGVFKTALNAIEVALKRGYRVCTNTTIFRESDVGDLHQLFGMFASMGVEGCMVSPAFEFKSVPDEQMFLERQESVAVFRSILDRSKGFRFYNNPLYLDFLRGQRTYQCNAWANPTFTVEGWRKPCYLLADEHTSNLDELFDAGLWDKYGIGKDARCANCMMHCGFEPSSIFEALGRPADWFTLIREQVLNRPKAVGVS